jgi:hypothetical protein
MLLGATASPRVRHLCLVEAGCLEREREMGETGKGESGDGGRRRAYLQAERYGSTGIMRSSGGGG